MIKPLTIKNNACFRRIKALVIKEWCQIVRDPSSYIVGVVFPTILLIIYGYGVSLDLDHVRIGVVMEESTPYAQSLTQSFTDCPYFDAKIVRDRRLLDQDIVGGKIRGFVVIPSYFSSYLLNPSRTAPLQVVGDGSEPNTATFVQNYVSSTVQGWLQTEKVAVQVNTNPSATTTQTIGDPTLNTNPVQIQERVWYNEELLSRNFLIPGSLAIIMALIGTMLTALVIAREWERGTMEALMSTPVRITEIIVAKLISYFLLGIIAFIICFLISVLFYQVPFRGSFFALFISGSAFLISSLGLGLVISTLAKNQLVASQIALFASYLPAFMLSGFIFEIASMPKIIQIITYFLTPRYFVSSLQSIFLAGNIWELILKDTACILGLGALFYIITIFRISKRLE